jgi:uncharacterized protein YjbI with pentapeptide repeats
MTDTSGRSVDERAQAALKHWETDSKRLRKSEPSAPKFLPPITPEELDAAFAAAELPSNVRVPPELVGWKLNTGHCRRAFGPTLKDRRNLRGADFRWADLWGVSFASPHLYQARFEGAMLANADFGAADLSETRFWDADLGSADLSRTKGLVAGNLAGAKLADAKLPKPLEAFGRLDHADKTAQSAKATFIALLAACLYCWLTIGSTEDAGLLLNASKTALPIINTEIALGWFYLIAPALLLAVYVYFQYYLQSLWRDLAMLPSVFPDGTPLDERIDPWPMRLIASRHLWRLRLERPATMLEYLQYAVAVLLGWFLVPLTILWFLMRYLPMHHWAAWPLLALTLSAFLILGGSYWLAVVTLWERGRDYRMGSKKGVMRALSRPAWGLGLVLVAVPAALAIVVTLQSFGLLSREGGLAGVATVVRMDADLAGADLSAADLSGRDLRNADFNRAILKGADLSGASLAGATFEGACGDAKTRLPDGAPALQPCPEALPAPDPT